jgi:uncharacterized repeat protein (TIGR01451 family)
MWRWQTRGKGAKVTQKPHRPTGRGMPVAPPAGTVAQSPPYQWAGPAILKRRSRSGPSGCGADCAETDSSAGPQQGRGCRVRPAPALILLALATLQAAWLSAGVDRWTTSGPGQPGVTRIIADPFRAENLLVELRESTARMTNNGGATWFPVSLTLDSWELNSVVFDPQAPEVALALLTRGQPVIPVLPEIAPPLLCRTLDGGANWSRSETHIDALAASRSNPGLIYGADSHHLYTSTDGGQTWETRGPSVTWPTPRYFLPIRMAVSGGQPETIWVAGNQSILESTDGGWTWRSWELTENSLSVLAVAGASGEVVLTGDTVNVWRSTDGGESWADTGLTDVSRLVVHPTSRSTVFCVDSTHLYRSLDAGLQWETLWTVDSADSILDVAVTPGASERTYLACNQRGLLVSEGGNAWTPVDLGVYLAVSCVSVDPLNNLISYGGSGGFYTSTDGGANWAADTRQYPGQRIWDLAASLSGRLYAVGGRYSSAIYVSANQETSWQKVLQAEDFSLDEVCVAPAAPEIVYVAKYRYDGGGVYRSTNLGHDWTFLNQGLPTEGLRHLAVDPQDSWHLLGATDSGLYVSWDGGESWTLAIQFWNRPIGVVAFHPSQPGVALASCGSQLFRSEDGGLFWSVVADLGETVEWTCFDPQGSDTAYAAGSAYLYRGPATGDPWVRFALPEGWTTDWALSGGTAPTTLHLATPWGVQSLTPVSEAKSDFEIAQTAPARLSGGGLAVYTLKVTNHGPDDFFGPLVVEDFLPATLDFVSVECPGWRTQQMVTPLSFVHDGRFTAGEAREIIVTAKAADYTKNPTTNRVTVTASRPVDLVSSNDTAVTETPASRGTDRGAQPASRRPR